MNKRDTDNPVCLPLGPQLSRENISASEKGRNGRLFILETYYTSLVQKRPLPVNARKLLKHARKQTKKKKKQRQRL